MHQHSIVIEHQLYGVLKFECMGQPESMGEFMLFHVSADETIFFQMRHINKLYLFDLPDA